MSPKFLACLVILCFKRQYPKQKTVSPLKSKYLPPKILAWLRCCLCFACVVSAAADFIDSTQTRRALIASNETNELDLFISFIHFFAYSLINIVLCNVFTPTRKTLDFKHASQKREKHKYTKENEDKYIAVV